MSNSVLTVSQLNRYVKSVLEGDYKIKDVYIKGEISNFVNHYKSGHFYFTLKESSSSVKAVMFATYAQGLRFEPENGMSVIVRCSVSLYERDGSFQIYVYEMQPEGKGDLQIAFEQLYQKMEKKGYFALEHKKKMPSFPEKIGIVTSETGAAVHDIISVISRRYPPAKLVLYPALVQGEGAADSIVTGIEAMNQGGICDLIIVGRGGGSMEDLWAFNEEKVVKAVYASKVPIISAVGHEIDFTLCDYAADLRAPTPSAAAELAVPNVDDVKYTVAAHESKIEQRVKELVTWKKQQLQSIMNIQCFKNPAGYLDNNTKKMEYLSKTLQSQIKNVIMYKREQLIRRASSLEALNPIARLAAGYSITMDSTGKIVRSVREVAPGDQVKICLKDGHLIGEIKEIDKTDWNPTERKEVNGREI